MLSGAGVACTGEGEQHSNHAARGGLGAVMGSKSLKAIVMDKAPKGEIPFVDKNLFKAASKRFAKEIMENPKLGPKGNTHTYGTASITAAK